MRYWFCRHNYEITYAKLPKNECISGCVVGNLAYTTNFIGALRTGVFYKDYQHHYLTSHTYDKNFLYIFVKKCQKCGQIISCDAFDATKFLEEKENLQDALTELKEHLL